MTDCPGCLNLRDELDRLKEAASLDLNNFAANLAAKDREIGRLKAELTKMREGESDNDEVRQILLHWRAATGKTTRAYIGADGKRYKVAKAALKRTNLERCLKAIDGLASRPFAGPRGRAAEQYPGAKRFDDVEHALGDETRQEQCEAYIDEPPDAPTVSPQPPAPAQRQPVPLDDDAIRVKARWNEQGHFQSDWQHPLDPFGDFLANLEVKGFTVRRRGESKAQAQCPAHDDRSPSLDVTRAADGKVLMICRSHQCSAAEVCAAVDWPMKWLWPLAQVATDERARAVAVRHDAGQGRLGMAA